MIAPGDAHAPDAGQSSGGQQQTSTQTGEFHWCEADLEKHFKDHGKLFVHSTHFTGGLFIEQNTRGTKKPVYRVETC